MTHSPDPDTAAPARGRSQAPPREGVVALLRAYQEAIEVAGRLPPVVWLAGGQRRIARRARLPRTTLLLDTFLSLHMARTLAALRRRCEAEAAVEPDSATAEADSKVIDHFTASLVPRSFSKRVFAVAVAAFLLAYVITNFILQTSEVGLIRELTKATVTLDRGAAIDAIQRSNLIQMAGAAVIVCWSLWLVLLVPISSFRVKRALFSCSPRSVSRLNARGESETLPSRQSVYGLESQAFATLECKPVSEMSVDLVAHAFLAASIGILGIGIALSVDNIRGAVLERVGLGVWSACFTAAAAAALLATYGRRRRRTSPVRVDRGPRRWGRRLLAHLIDVLLPAAIAAGVASLASPAGEWVVTWLGAFTTIGAGLAVVFVAMPGHGNGQTIGKRLFGLRVISGHAVQVGWRQSLLREGILKWSVFGPPSIAFFYGLPALVALLWIVWDGDGRPLHDVLAGTQVVAAAGLEREPGHATEVHRSSVRGREQRHETARGGLAVPEKAEVGHGQHRGSDSGL